MDSKQANTGERRICVETDDGRLLWIPESKLEAWEKANHKAPLSDSEKDIAKSISKRIYGDRPSGSNSPPSHDSVLNPRIFVHDANGGGHWEDYNPDEDRPPYPTEPPPPRRKASSRSLPAPSTASILKELRYTKLRLGSSLSEVNTLNSKLSSCQTQIRGLKTCIRLIVIASILLSILLCFIVSSSTKAKYDRLIDQAYSDGNDAGYDAGYKDGYDKGKKASASSSSSSSSSIGSSRDTAIADGYIGNRKTKKYHYSTCSYLPDKENQVVFDSAEEAESSGYDPCGHCNPR